MAFLTISMRPFCSAKHMPYHSIIHNQSYQMSLLSDKIEFVIPFIRTVENNLQQRKRCAVQTWNELYLTKAHTFLLHIIILLISSIVTIQNAWNGNYNSTNETSIRSQHVIDKLVRFERSTGSDTALCKTEQHISRYTAVPIIQWFAICNANGPKHQSVSAINQSINWILHNANWFGTRSNWNLYR